MGLFRSKYNTTLVQNLNTSARESEIFELEAAREDMNREIESLLVSYKKLTGRRKATKGAKKIGKSKKDYSYWHKFYE